MQKISTWISNHVTTKSTSRVPTLSKTTWSGHEVFYIQDEARISERIEKLKQEGYVHIAAINKARGALWDGLEDEERQAYEDTAESWTLEGPDPEVREQ